MAIINLRRLIFLIILSFIFFTKNIYGQPDYQDTSAKLFSFGLVADIQYADAPQKGKRDYRGSLKRLEKCVEIFNRHDLSFVVSLGDLIDHNYASFEKPEKILSKLKAPLHNVIGNHEFSVDDSLKKYVRPRLVNSKKGYYDFVVGQFRFIVLDGSDLSVLAAVKGSKAYKKGMEEYEMLKKKKQNNAYLWNGGLGKKQFRWLRRSLNHADKKGEHVVIFCHWPLLPERATRLWGNRKVISLLNKHKSVVAYIAGHDHAGSYVKKGHIHYFTLKAIVESKAETSCGIMSVYPDRLSFKGFGDQEDRILTF